MVHRTGTSWTVMRKISGAWVRRGEESLCEEHTVAWVLKDTFHVLVTGPGPRRDPAQGMGLEGMCREQELLVGTPAFPIAILFPWPFTFFFLTYIWQTESGNLLNQIRIPSKKVRKFVWELSDLFKFFRLGAGILTKPIPWNKPVLSRRWHIYWPRSWSWYVNPTHSY